MAKDDLVVGHYATHPSMGGLPEPVMRNIPQPPPGDEPKTLTEAECREREKAAFVKGWIDGYKYGYIDWCKMGIHMSECSAIEKGKELSKLHYDKGK